MVLRDMGPEDDVQQSKLTCATLVDTPTAEMRRGCVQMMLHAAPLPAAMASSKMYWGT